MVVNATGKTIALFYHEDQIFAVDNRCPHMGFPLHRGSVKQGILTCHWHHARFDLACGGTFDPWADDVQSFPVEIREGAVWLNPHPPMPDPTERWKTRLQDGLQEDLSLLISKATIGLLHAGADYREPLRIGVRFGIQYRAAGWGSGLTILTAMANILPFLRSEDQGRALYKGLVHVARDCDGAPPRFALPPLPTHQISPERLKQWFRNFVHVRDADGAERCLRTAIEAGLMPQQIADILCTAATDHLYIDSGHILDFINKACELLDQIGWEYAGEVLPSLTMGLTGARRSEELSSWRHPIDLAALLFEAYRMIPHWCEEGKKAQWPWERPAGFIPTLLSDDPHAIMASLQQALREGASGEALAAAVAYAAALRIAQFSTTNEFGDWDTVLHTFTYTNAVHQAYKRAPSLDLLRGVFDGAMSVYLDRFLNTPPVKIPHQTSGKEEKELLQTLLQTFDVQQQVDQAGSLVSDYLSSKADPALLLQLLGQALLREDADFHTYQVVEAGFRQYAALQHTDAGRHILIAVARYMAAHFPTFRALEQTYRIALRLHRGESLYDDNAQ
jgi:nitrite reductase/ring-hydroxylating ferredoxin subunit